MTAIVHEWPEINRANLWPRVCAWLVVLIGILLLPGTANAYGAMTHALVAFKSRDATIKFLQTTTKNQQGLNSSEQNSVVLDSIAGALLHDVGYIYPPYLSYSNLWHYHATGGFVEYLGFRAGKLDVRTDRLNALAFALGAVNHYTSDQIGHFEVTNRASATLLNKQNEVGERLAYEDNEKQHMCIESALDKIALRKLSTSELGEFLLALKGLAALVKKREYPRQGIFDLVSEALTKVYGLEAKVLQNLGADAFLYANLRDAYLVMLVYLRSVIENSNLDYRLDKDYFNGWPSQADIREIKNKLTTLLSCDPNFNEVNAFVDKCGCLAPSLGSSVSYYAQTLNSSRWPSSINLDTGSPTAQYAYLLADWTLQDLVSRKVLPPLTSLGYFQESVAQGEQQRQLFLCSANVEDPAVLNGQLKRLQGWLDDNSRGARFNVSAWREDPKQRFARIDITECLSKRLKSIDLGGTRELRVGNGLVCLPKAATVLEVWIGAQAEAGRVKSPDDFYRSMRYVLRTTRAAPSWSMHPAGPCP